MQAMEETVRPPLEAASPVRAYRGILRAIADSVDGNVDGALDYVLIKHGMQDGSSYSPTAFSDGDELDDLLKPTSQLRAPRHMNAARAAETLQAVGALDVMRARRAQLLIDGFSASLMEEPHCISLSVSRAGELFGHVPRPDDEIAEGIRTATLSLVVRANGCVAAVTSLGQCEGFHVEEILVPEALAASYGRADANLADYIDARARKRYQDQMTKCFARFLVLAFTAFDGRLMTYLRARSTGAGALVDLPPAAVAHEHALM